jgi:CubicO group peptidase (beta-lactamase class C family)
MRKMPEKECFMEERQEYASWPTHGWEKASLESQGMNSDILMDLYTFIQDQQLPIHALLIARHGYLIVEYYYRGQTARDTQALRCCTKSAMSALVGIALCKDSLYAFDQTLPDLLADERLFSLDEQKRAITLYHLLTMTSGIDSLYSGRYHFEGHTSFVEAVFATPLLCPSGQTFRYGDPPVEVLGQLLEQVTGIDLVSFATDQLFRPLGISTDPQSGFLWEKKPDGRYRAAAGLHLTPRDMAKFGYLYLREGYWEDQQLIPSVYAQASTRSHNMGGVPEGCAYGLLWWVTTLGGHATFYALGIGGQFIVVIPAVDLVVVISSEDVRRSGDPQKALLKGFILPAIVPEG